jgi:hypothetical protein
LNELVTDFQKERAKIEAIRASERVFKELHTFHPQINGKFIDSQRREFLILLKKQRWEKNLLI